jgi:hypothetical protein
MSWPCARCSWPTDHCTCHTNTATTADIERRHRESVERARIHDLLRLARRRAARLPR